MAIHTGASRNDERYCPRESAKLNFALTYWTVEDFDLLECRLNGETSFV